MLKIIKHLKPFVASIIAVICLLSIQAVCDLSLPDYMSNIVNVGIQQKGVENAVPGVIRKSELDKLTLFMNENEKKKVDDNYVLLDKNNLSQSELKNDLKDYPQLDKEPLYKLHTEDKNTINELNDIFGKPMLITQGIEKDGSSAFTAPGDNKAPAKLPPNTDPFAVIAKLPQDQIDAMKEKADEKFKNMPGSMVTQSAVSFIENEYKKIGINTDKLQSNYILTSGGKMLLLSLVSMAATVIVSLLAAKVAAGLGRDLRKKVFRKVTSFSNAEFDKFSTASLITRSTNDIQQVQTLMVMLLRIVFYAPILGIGGIIKVLTTDLSMGWIIAVAVIAILSLVIGLFSIAIPKFKSIQKLVDKINLITRESLTGMLVIRAFNNQKHEEKKFEKGNQDLTRTNLFVSRLMSFMMPMMMLIMNAVTVLIIWVGSHQVDMGHMQVGDMMAFMQYTMQIIMAFLMISMVSIMVPRASVSAQRIAEVLDTDLSIHDAAEPKTFASDKRGYVEFKNVSFKYPGAEEDVLSNITFTAKPGETTAFIGSTGSGKSTLINLIPRFYDVTSGQILIDGTDIREVSQKELREKIGYVPQKGVLFSGTIESNLKYGKKEATEEELAKAAEIAQAMEFINAKPESFRTEISQGGTNVSGGQKQRLSIARALTKKSEIFIFDDSFSALDFKTDAALRRALNNEIAGSTILLVAQRISTIMNADKIIVLDEGKIVGTGTHEELMENCEVYKQIALSQLSREELSS
ncbi:MULTISPECIES: ABC transporter ATP-binding protein [Bacillus]|uniref:ABC transporter ATP-binding protein n=1 Tax=Bacillus TaxID=1386 RepID=UPI000302B1D2|nr:ABC transporter ATP-binding protein [Bacillus pseudomycoides]MED1597173.1 ABC transporter ATP-binding protein [Bacillus pseudomycoides]MED4712699.1 ABC transporter ATP-binding protein [Bacillus pseudomycoides]OOR49234.1 ABC transporter [Bacillus pseudomycoides]PDY09130.1 ABC transporter ATP-binding protein [Bacillus pseudomycoides]PEU34127.1 ABC transporter ATP-binding protein [Bacillus pseudomycoides]